MTAKPLEEQLLDIARARRILDAVRARMREDGGTAYDDSEPPEIEMLGDDRFIAHRYVPNGGPDRADHYILRGRIDGDAIELAPFYVRLTESQSAHYDRRVIVDLLRAGDFDGAWAEVGRIRAVDNPPCSKCGSKNIVIWERFFGWNKYACNNCGHNATE